MEDKNYFIIVSKIKYKDTIREEPLMQKLSSREHAILAWENKGDAEMFLKERKMNNYKVIITDKNYFEERANMFKKQNLVLKMKILP